jgi:hypothetical protein
MHAVRREIRYGPPAGINLFYTLPTGDGVMEWNELKGSTFRWINIDRLDSGTAKALS